MASHLTRWGVVGAAVLMLAGCTAESVVSPKVSPASSPSDACRSAFEAGVEGQAAARDAEDAIASEVDADGVRDDDELERMREARQASDRAFDSQLEETLRACGDVPDWLAGAHDHPSVVGVEEVTDVVYNVLVGACSSDSIRGAQVCADSVSRQMQ